MFSWTTTICVEGVAPIPRTRCAALRSLCWAFTYQRAPGSVICFGLPKKTRLLTTVTYRSTHYYRYEFPAEGYCSYMVWFAIARTKCCMHAFRRFNGSPDSAPKLFVKHYSVHVITFRSRLDSRIPVVCRGNKSYIQRAGNGRN